jgi:hypothetical protein
MKVRERSLITVVAGLLLPLLAFGANLQAATGTFLTAAQYATGPQPESVAVADFNGDGIPDLAVANYDCNSHPCTPGSVSILLGKGDGTFKPHVDYAAGGGPSAIAVGDFNGDGKLDLAVADSTPARVSILLGNGDGTFQPHHDYVTAAAPGSIVVADFNQDGKLDVATGNYSPGYDGSVSVLLGNGDGTFQKHIDTSTAKVFSLATGDFNGDGKPDLALASDSKAVYVLLGNGNGTFQPEVSYATAADTEAVTIGDFNGDGKKDLAVAASGAEGAVAVLLGNGDGTFQKAVNYATDVQPISVAVADFNNDGKSDLAVGTQYGIVDVLLGNGDGTLKPYAGYETLGRALSLATGDFNQDGNTDVVTVDAQSPGHASVLLGRGNGTLQAPSPYPAGYGPGNVAVGDFNGDGKPDLVTADSEYGSGSTVAVLLGNGDGTFQNQVQYTTASDPVWVTAGDFNGDGKLDLAAANSAVNTVSVLLGNGDGTFQADRGYGTANEPTSVAVGDFNGDGKLDLVTANYSGTVSVLLGYGDGTFAPHVDYTTGTEPDSVAVGDFNGDGKVDLATANFYANTVSVLLGNGDGTFQKHVDYTVGIAPYSVAVGDFNGDGILDLVVANSSNNSNTVSILLGNGDGTFQPHTDYATGIEPQSVAVADFNGDGKLDLVTANYGAYGGNTASVLLGNGNGTFQPYVEYSAGGGPISVAVADFNLDGAADFVASDVSAGTVSISLNLGGTLLSSSSSPNPSSPGQSVTFTTSVAASVTASGRPAPTGTVTFYEGSTALGSGVLVSGVATFSTSSLSSGTNTITPVYSGDSNYNPHAGAPIIQTVTAGGPAVQLSPSSLTFATQLIKTSSLGTGRHPDQHRHVNPHHQQHRLHRQGSERFLSAELMRLEPGSWSQLHDQRALQTEFPGHADRFTQRGR